MWISESENETSSSANGDCATHLTAYCSVLMANKPLWLIQNQVQHYITWRKWIISELEFRKRWNSLMKAHQHYSTKLQVHVTSSSLPACKTIQGLAPEQCESVHNLNTSATVTRHIQMCCATENNSTTTRWQIFWCQSSTDLEQVANWDCNGHHAFCG